MHDETGRGTEPNQKFCLPFFLSKLATQGMNSNFIKWGDNWELSDNESESCLVWLCNLMVYMVHGILQARILKWVAFPFSRGFSQRRDQSQVSCIAGGFFTSWATREALLDNKAHQKSKWIIRKLRCVCVVCSGTRACVCGCRSVCVCVCVCVCVLAHMCTCMCLCVC